MARSGARIGIRRGSKPRRRIKVRVTESQFYLDRLDFRYSAHRFFCAAAIRFRAAADIPRFRSLAGAGSVDPVIFN